MKRLLILVFLLFSTPVIAQDQLVVDRIFLGSAPCVLRVGSGTPEGVVTATVCTVYYRTDTGDTYAKVSGTGNTGWAPLARTAASVGSFTSNGVVYGSGSAGAVATTAGGGSNTVLIANGGAPSFSTSPTITNLTATGNVGDPSYVSQTTGWRIGSDGGADFRYIFTDEMHAKLFIADLEQALAGGQIIAKSVAVLSQSFLCPPEFNGEFLWVEDLPSASNMAVFEANDVVSVRSFSRSSGSLTIADCIGTVSSYTDGTGGTEGTQRWTFLRFDTPVDGGSMGAVTIEPGSLVIDYGVSGNGYYEVNAIDGVYGINSPYSQIVTWTTTPAPANRTVRTRIGNLRGITSSTEYGLFAGNFAANSYAIFSNLNAEIRDIPLKLYDGATETIRLDATVPSFALGSPLPSAYGTGTGCWMGKDSSVYKARCGSPGGSGWFWDGSTFSIAGNGSGVTNINGGNIQTSTITTTQIAANTITADDIAANTITVGNLVATGFGDNVIKNGTFEGPTAAAGLAGWIQDSATGGTVNRTGTGPAGPGIIQIDSPGSGNFNSAGYLAVPVTPGSVYRVVYYVYADSSTTGGLYVRVAESTSANADVTRVRIAASPPSPQVQQTSITELVANGNITGTVFTKFELTYTVPSGVRWASLVLWNHTCLSGTVCQAIYFDGIEMQLQIGAGHIQANSITANEIAANAITTSELNADSVTSAKIAANTIVAGDISADTITANELAANSVTTSEIAANTITAGDIAANTITADRMDVSSLSAISANMGTLTAGSITGGTIDGATIKAGSGDEVTLDSSGISMQAGTGANNKIKWSDGVTVSAPNSGSTLYVDGNLTVERSIVVTGTGGAAAFSGGGVALENDSLTSPNMASSTGTTVIWETSCACLKKLSSSSRYKENSSVLKLSSPFAILKAKPILFDYRGKGVKRVVGLSAEELYAIDPLLVNLDSQGRPDSVRQDAVNVYLLEMIRELRREIAELKTKVDIEK